MSNGNGLATRQQTRQIAPSAPALDALPAWLRYLVAAYPAAQVSATTYLVYEDQFADVDAAVLMTAVKAAVKSHRFNTFPAVPEIWREVGRINERAALALHERAARLRSLRQRRHELLQRSFADDALPDEFDALADEYDALGYEATATSQRGRAARFAVELA